ncbi:MAG: SOS response-associated peptidase [Chloroflexota bacterium]
MCGRFTLTVDPAELKEAFQDYKFPNQFAPRFNVAPTQPILAIPNDGLNTADFFVWGLVPSWSKEPDIGNRLINARGETLAEKPSFRGSYKYKRCLILADGFYEWKSEPGNRTKVPYFIHLKDRKPFAFAGLWDEWNSTDGSQVRSCTIITTVPNELMKSIHDRMPVILHPADYAHWLDKSPQTPESLQPLIKPFPAEEMAAYPVSTLVNKPSVDHAELIQPA